ncbi:unnamed protein product [Closterium sp. NIES-64]|nr:unnamed protein product [Closterium sp. NIES-64]
MAGGEDFVEWEEAAGACGKTGEREGENGVELAPELVGDVGEKGVEARGEAVNGDNGDDLLCELVVVYEVRQEKFGRTADIDYLTITGVNLSLDPSTKPWRSVRTTDHCGTQTWSQGNKADLAWWLSLFHHYTVDLPYEDLQKDEQAKHRPIIYVNTANHLMGETNANPQFPLTTWKHYPLHRGGPPEAELFARKSILSKPILWNPFPGCLSRSCT